MGIIPNLIEESVYIQEQSVGGVVSEGIGIEIDRVCITFEVDGVKAAKSGIVISTTKVGEALEVLTRYHQVDPHDPTAEYYLSIVCAERYDFNKSWEYLKNAEAITAARDHHPAALRGLRSKLRTICPEP
ncbi:MAG: hypothetical protein P0S96_01155 [Simkaniaceae bacterium]|nr:hypothetical protein [Candidatus Sacchlamyda saccharinae]